MSKKNIWKFIAVLLIIGAAVTGCILYLSRYRDFTRSLDEDFDDFEDEEAEEADTTEAEDTDTASVSRRAYVSIPLEQSPAE